jgi:hypothetical protein
MRIVPTLLAVGLALSSVSASAATNTKQDKQPAASTAAPATSSADRKYCLESGNDATGTRLYTRECRTKAEWAKRGVDVDELSKPD